MKASNYIQNQAPEYCASGLVCGLKKFFEIHVTYRREKLS